MAIRELMNVMRVAVNIIAKGLLVEQQEGWVLWVIVSVGYLS
jgi:hypothetical protein